MLRTDTPAAVPVVIPAPRRFSSRPMAPARWERCYRRLVLLGDLVVVCGVAAVAIALGVGGATGDPWRLGTATSVGMISAATVLLGLGGCRSWDRAVLGQGSEEFNRVLRGVALAGIVLAFCGLAVKSDAVRPWVFGVLPATALVALLARYGARRVLHHLRAHGRCMQPVLVVGPPETIIELATRTRRVPHHGWVVVAACTPGGHGGPDGPQIGDVPVVGDLDQVADHVRERGVRIVAVAPAAGWTPRRLHQLSWDLEGSGAELVVDPGLMEVGGPRLHVEPVDGLPLLRLTEPRFSGLARVVKAVTDRVAAALLLVLAAPLLLGVAIAVRHDGGPALYRQVRVGMQGRPFKMIKFRSMVVDADRVRPELLAQNDAAGPLFKLRHDPRVTPVGAFLRRWSLDELPQLINVLLGQMSLVGPRPPLPREVSTFSHDALRKLLVRPGLTGMWQVSGRSDLSWEDTVRLDLRYVENWSPAMDLLILWKTIWAVLQKRGAY